ncbi:uncharacterized protein LOC131149799 isoform X2 [Malania oleifera]|uniref:uncharacterized protein LOC131149799 isoform X2 n=1 Tax=Malania oleifera TaxID=397392 RepID=UPI0025AE936D|nr:uncharacterized protein LOC131149799 isoform X2 [Malania oleifera]
MQDISMLPSGSSLESPSYSRCNLKQKVSAVEDLVQLDGSGNKIRSSFDDEIFFSTEDKSENIWDGRSSFLDDNFLEEMEYDNSWNCPHRMDDDSAEFLEFETSDFVFEDSYRLKPRRGATNLKCSFNILDSPVPHPKHQRSKIINNFTASDGARYPTEERCSDFGGIANHPAWSKFMVEDTRDSLSLVSEESCSSSAVRGEATTDLPKNSIAGESIGRHINDFGSGGHKHDVKHLYDEETRYSKKDVIREQENVNGSKKYSQISNLTRSKLPCGSNFNFWKKSENESWFYENASLDRNSGINSFGRTSERVSSGWTDTFGAFPIPELHNSAKLPSDRYKDSSTIESSPSGHLSSRERSFHQPFGHLHSHNSPIFSNIGLGLGKPDLSSGSKMAGIAPESSLSADPREDAEFPNVIVQESRSSENRKSKSNIPPTNCQKFELENEAFMEHANVIFENAKPVDACEIMDIGGECEKAREKTPEQIESPPVMGNPKVAQFSERTEETSSSSLKVHDTFCTSVDEKNLSALFIRYHHDSQILVPFQDGIKERGDPGPGNGTIVVKGQKKCSDSSHQVMMLESYVLQLLCVQKVLKEASAQDTLKELKRQKNQHQFVLEMPYGNNDKTELSITFLCKVWLLYLHFYFFIWKRMDACVALP